MFQIKARLTSQIIRSYRRTLTVYVTASSTIREPCDADVLHMTRECDLDVLVGRFRLTYLPKTEDVQQPHRFYLPNALIHR